MGDGAAARADARVTEKRSADRHRRKDRRAEIFHPSRMPGGFIGMGRRGVAGVVEKAAANIAAEKSASGDEKMARVSSTIRHARAIAAAGDMGRHQRMMA